MPINNILIVLTLMLSFSVECNAEEKTKPISQLQKKILDLSYQQMNLAIDALEKKSAECQQQESNVVLSPTLFNTIDLPLEQWKTALLFLSFKAADQCETKALWGSAVIALNRYKLAEKKYYGKNIVKTRYRQGNFCCAIWERKLKLELAYLDLDAVTRKKLQNVVELHRPFNVLKTVDAVELWLK